MKSYNSIDYIIGFLGNRDIFWSDLTDRGVFNKDAFEKYTYAIYQVSKMELSEKERFKLAKTIWEISYNLQCYIRYHLDPYDTFHIEDFDEDYPIYISNILYYTAVNFSNNKELEERNLKIDSWA